MFKKLNLNLSDISTTDVKGDLFEDHKKFVMFEIKNMEYLKSILDNRVKFLIEPVKIAYIEISNEGLFPHTDGYVGCSLNCVLEDTESYTIFWNLKRETAKVSNTKKLPDGSSIATETTGYVYPGLEYQCSFKSTTGDSILLDVRKIHSVEKYNCKTKRKLLSFRWDPEYSLDEIYNSIQII